MAKSVKKVLERMEEEIMGVEKKRRHNHIKDTRSGYRK